MIRRNAIDMSCMINLGINPKDCIYLGQGRSGVVFLMPNGRVIKVFRNQESCIHEYMILQSVRGNRHFPIVFEHSGNCMIREYVGGTCLIQYIKRYGLSRRLAVNLIKLIEDFKRLGFSRLDIRCSHIFVQQDESVMVIDPRKHYTIKLSYPRSMLRKLCKLGVASKFMRILREEHPSLYNLWRRAL